MNEARFGPPGGGRLDSFGFSMELSLPRIRASSSSSPSAARRGVVVIRACGAHFGVAVREVLIELFGAKGLAGGIEPRRTEAPADFGKPLGHLTPPLFRRCD